MSRLEILELLQNLNATHIRLHENYEKLFWVSYMGDHSVDEEFKKALAARDAFRSDPKNLSQVNEALSVANKAEKQKLEAWKLFFSKFQTPERVLTIKKQIDALEAKILESKTKQIEGYRNPYTKKFVPASRLKMRQMMRVHADEKIRRACFDASEDLAVLDLEEYVKLVDLRNSYATELGFPDFYHYKTMTEEGMKAPEIFSIFDKIYKRTKSAFSGIRKLEKSMPGLRKPWNFAFMMSGDFTTEQDQYFQFDQALMRWGRSFAQLGIDYRGGELQLDLLDRPGKYSNGFCHYPGLVHFENGRRIPGTSNFTCNVVPGQVGSGAIGMMTLFHEGGHAADRLNSELTETCLATEYPPASTAWAETQSMFLDTMHSSIEWKIRYAKNSEGQAYPFELYERILRKVNVVSPLRMMSIGAMVAFERTIYSEKNLTKAKVIALAKKVFRQHTDYSTDTLWILSVPHLYSWESACSYHGYGLAELALAQWREYFYAKYGYIVDNPNISREMARAWKLGSSKTFKEFVNIATGKDLTPNAFIKNVTMSVDGKLKLAQARLKRMQKVKAHSGKVDLNASIRMVHGKQVIADNSGGFEAMAAKYAKFLSTQNQQTT